MPEGSKTRRNDQLERKNTTERAEIKALMSDEDRNAYVEKVLKIYSVLLTCEKKSDALNAHEVCNASTGYN